LRRRGSSHAAILIASIGILTLFQAVFALTFGTTTLNMHEGALSTFEVGGLVLTELHVMAAAVSIVIFPLLQWFLTATRYGQALRALADNPRLAVIYGIDTDRFYLIIFALGSALAAVSVSLSAFADRGHCGRHRVPAGRGRRRHGAGPAAEPVALAAVVPVAGDRAVRRVDRLPGVPARRDLRPPAGHAQGVAALEYAVHLLIIILVYIALTVSLDLMVGHTGIFSFAHAAFYGIGAYATAILTVYAGWNWFPALLAAVAIGALIALLLGIPTLRLGGDYLILALFGFQSIVVTIILNWEAVTNGPFGIRGIPRPSLGPLKFESGPAMLAFTAAVVALVVWVHARFASAPMRQMLHAIRDDETVAQALGINALRAKVTVFTLGGAFAALAGGLTAFYLRFVDVNSFSLFTMILLLAMVFVGGSRSILGAIVGPTLLLLFPEMFRFVGETNLPIAYIQQALYGLLLIVLMLYRPEGLVGRARPF
jgi:branched-chain amino acid transport system permease protein